MVAIPLGYLVDVIYLLLFEAARRTSAER